MPADLEAGAPAVSAEARRPTEVERQFLSRLVAKRATKVSGGSEQAENAVRQRCRRYGWALYRDTGDGFGWLLTRAGRAALAAQEKPHA